LKSIFFYLVPKKRIPPSPHLAGIITAGAACGVHGVKAVIGMSPDAEAELAEAAHD